MRKHIRNQIIRMAGLMLCLAGLAAFAWDFVYAGLMAKIYLNGFIWCVFGFGAIMAFRSVLRLRNEELAFSALIETYNDIKQEALEAAEDPYWKHYRCLQPGLVYHRPRLLGHFFEIVYEELMRTKNLRISVVTMQNLVHGVESKLWEDRSLVNYLAGLLIFLGLIGAFIGLMQMVQSVGAIVGGLSADAVNENTDAFSHLITQLQAPLNGMAIGFSSSLFGLTGSLSLGLLARFSAQAGTALKAEFASWLGNVVQIEAGSFSEGGAAGMKGLITQGAATKQLADAAATMTHHLSQSHHSYEKMADILERVGRAQADQATATAKMAMQMAHLVTLQEEIKGNLIRANSHGSTMASARDEFLRIARSVETQLTEGFAQLAGSISAYQNAQAENVQHLVALNEKASRSVSAAAKGEADVGVDDLAPQIAASVETAVAKAISQQQGAAGLTPSSTPASSPFSATAPELENRINGLQHDVRALEDHIAGGFESVTRAVETMFTSYADQVVRPAVRGVSSAKSTPVPQHVEGEVQELGAAVDREEMMKRLYAKVAQNYVPAGGEG